MLPRSGVPKTLKSEAVPEGHTDVVNGCAFAPDGRPDHHPVAHGDEHRCTCPQWTHRLGGSVCVWDVAAATCVAALRVAGPVTGIAWHPEKAARRTGQSTCLLNELEYFTRSCGA